MALKSGLAAQWGFKAETTWSTPVTVDKFLPLVSETFTTEKERIESAAIVAGRRVLTSDMWTSGKTMVKGGIQTELFNKDISTLFSHMMGDASSPYTPGDLVGYGLTVQIGTPDASGTVNPRTYTGAKITEWELACKVGEIATLGLDFVACREVLHRTVSDGATNSNTTVTSATAAFTADDIGKPISGGTIPAGATITAVASATSVTISAAASGTATGVTLVIGLALASASYTSGLQPVKFTHGSVTVGGTAVSVKGATLKGNNGLDTERYFLGSDVISEPLEAALRDYTCELEVEFTDKTQYLRYLNGTEHAVVLTFTSGSAFSLVITTNVRFDGVTPNVDGAGILTQSIPMKCVASGADSTAISIALTEQS